MPHFHSSDYRQKRGRMKRNGSKTGMIKREDPQVQKLPIIAITIMQTMEKEKMKHPPRFRYWTKTVTPSFHVDESKLF
jgi:hypothetical protein